MGGKLRRRALLLAGRRAATPKAEGRRRRVGKAWEARSRTARDEELRSWCETRWLRDLWRRRERSSPALDLQGAVVAVVEGPRRGTCGMVLEETAHTLRVLDRASDKVRRLPKKGLLVALPSRALAGALAAWSSKKPLTRSASSTAPPTKSGAFRRRASLSPSSSRSPAPASLPTASSSTATPSSTASGQRRHPPRPPSARRRSGSPPPRHPSPPSSSPRRVLLPRRGRRQRSRQDNDSKAPSYQY
mmetsp:Transcript_32245/g.102818  ORF Transcript_32245/g.102818 Transcript_32245/m.102818 type:complete len:246 (+) Transcript_32245:230-967(+)